MTNTTIPPITKPSSWRLVGISALSSAGAFVLWYPIMQLLLQVMDPAFEILALICYLVVFLLTMIYLQSRMSFFHYSEPMEAYRKEQLRLFEIEKARNEARLNALQAADMQRYEELEAEDLLSSSEYVQPLKRRRK